MEHIKNIYCIGRNYSEHVKELNNQMPEQPLIFSKPTHALALADKDGVVLPSGKGDIHHELEIVLEMNCDYEAGLTVDDLVKTMYLGLDLTLRDEQAKLKAAGLPWLLSKGFKNSAILSQPIDYPSEAILLNKEFSLEINNKQVQVGKMNQMLFSLDTMLTYLAENIGLKKGDIIFTGTPAGVGPLQDKDELKMIYDGKVYGELAIKI